MRSVLKLLMAAVALVGCLAAPRPVPAAGSNPSLDSASRTTPYTRLYVFGDSYSDIGGGYVDGNGPTAVAYLGWLMGLQIASSQAPHAPERSLVFAVSGAGTGDAEGRRVKEALLGYGMLNQVRDFESRVKSGDIRFDPNSTLFFIAGGLNDGRLQTEQTVANESWPASSTNRTSAASAMSSRAHSQLVPPTTSYRPAAMPVSSAALSPIRSTPACEEASSGSSQRWAIRTVAPASWAASATASRKFPMTRCDWAVTPTTRPRATSASAIRAPVYVLPVPGGPWIARTL